jgi:hypothetical protein
VADKGNTATLRYSGEEALKVLLLLVRELIRISNGAAHAETP